MKVADIEVKNDRTQNPKGDGTASGTAKADTSDKKKPKSRDSRVLVDNKIVFPPCNLMEDDGDGGLRYVQDWIVEPADATGTYRVKNRVTNEPYDTLTVEAWQAKCAAVKTAMVEAYKDSNFGPKLASDPNFCEVEARRLIPDFTSVHGAFGSLAHGPVQMAEAVADPERFFKLESTRFDTRREMYEWSESPLETNNIEFASQRYLRAFKDGNLNVAVFRRGTPLFPAEDVKLITNAMLRPPSSLSTVTGFVQTWMYDNDANQMVPRTWKVGERNPASNLVEGYKANFDSVRAQMMAAYAAFWFPEDAEEVDSGGQKTTFGEWKEASKFQQDKEIGAIIPAFHPKWGYMKHMYSHTKPGVPGPSKAGKAYTALLELSKVAYGFKGQETGGYDEAVRRFASLQLDLRRGKDKQLVAVARLPLDYMWSKSPITDRTAAVAKATPESMKKRGTGQKKPRGPPPDKFPGMVEGTYLRLEQEIKSKRLSRARKLGKATKELEESLPSATPADAEGIKSKIEELVAAAKAEFESEEKQLKDLYDLKVATDPNFAENEQDAYFDTLQDEDKIQFLRKLNASKLKGKRNQTVRQNEQLRFLDRLKQVLENSTKKDDMLKTEVSLFTKGRMSRLISNKKYIAMPEEKKAEARARTKKKNSRFEELVNMTPEERAEALKPKPRAPNAKGKKAIRKKRQGKASKQAYLDMDWESKMNEDEVRRTAALKDLKKDEKDKNRKDVWESFKELLEPADEAERALMFQDLPEGQKLRAERVYKVIFERIDAAKKEEKASLNGLAQTVLQYTFLPEYKEYVKQAKYDRLSDEDKAKLKKKDEDSVRLKQIKELIAQGKIPEAVALMEADHKARMDEERARRADAYDKLVEEVKTDKIKAMEDADSFDDAEFADFWMDEIEEAVKEYDISEYTLEQNFIYSSEDLKGTSKDDALDLIDALKERFDSSSKIRLQRVVEFVESRLAEILNTNIVALARIEAQGQIDKEQQRGRRDAAVRSIYTKINNERKLLVGMTADKQLEQLESLDISEEIKVVNEIDDQIQRKKEAAEFQHKIAVAKDKALRAFATLVESLRDYDAISSTPVMQELIGNGTVERPAPLLKDGMVWKSLAASVLSPDAAASVPPIKTPKPKKERDLYYFLEKAQEAADKEAAKFWTRKERRGLDERDEEDRRDLQFKVDDDNIVYDTDITNPQEKYNAVVDNLMDLWKITQKDAVTGLCKSTFMDWVADQKFLFEKEQKSLREAGVRPIQYSRENLVAFVATGIVTSEFNEDGFKRISLLPDPQNFADNTGGVTALSRWTDTDGNVIFYDDDDAVAKINHYAYQKGSQVGPADSTTKQVLAVHLTENDVYMYFPDALMEELKPYMWIRTVSDPPGAPPRTFYSIFRPWKTEGYEEHLKAFGKTVEQMTNWTAAVFAQDFVKPGQFNTEEKVVKLLKMYEEYGFCTVDPETKKVQIKSKMFSARNFKSLASDGTESVARKKELATAAQEFKEWIDKHWPEIYKDEAKASGSAIDTTKKQPDAADDSDEEDDAGDEEEYSGDEGGGEEDGDEMEDGREQREGEVANDDDLSDVGEDELPNDVPLVDLPDAAPEEGDDDGEEEEDDEEEDDEDFEDSEGSDVEEEYDENAESDDPEQAGDPMDEDGEEDGELEVLPQGIVPTPSAGPSTGAAPSLSSSMRSLSVAPARPAKQAAWWGQRSAWWSPSYGP